MSQPHTSPTLEDSGYVIWDSHAINAYLVGKYGKDDSLYPRDIHCRTLIDQRLDFDSGVVCFTFNFLRNPLLYKDNINAINKIYEVVEEFFEKDNKWIAGPQMTIADLSLLPSITSLGVMVPIEAEKCPKLVKWIQRAETMPFYEANKKGLCKLKSFIASLC